MGQSHLDYLLACAAEAGVGLDEFRPVPLAESASIEEHIRLVFGDGLACLFWPRSKSPCALPSCSYRFDDGGGWHRLEAIVPDSTGLVWFVCEDWGSPGSIFFEGTPAAIQKVLGNTHGYEYFLVSKQFTWLVGEENHGITFAVGEPVASRLGRLISAGDPVR